jgi:hypothetical protein
MTTNNQYFIDNLPLLFQNIEHILSNRRGYRLWVEYLNTFVENTFEAHLALLQTFGPTMFVFSDFMEDLEHKAVTKNQQQLLESTKVSLRPTDVDGIKKSLERHLGQAVVDLVNTYWAPEIAEGFHKNLVLLNTTRT